jgi:hypothetical protein
VFCIPNLVNGLIFAKTNTITMKPILTILICFLSVAVIAQTGTTKSSSAGTPKKVTTCYDQWYSVFKERGASPVANGTHDVIISLRNEYDYAECFLGKVEVKDGKLNSKLQIQKVDGSYEEFDKKASTLYQNTEGTLKDELRSVTNGMSESLVLGDGEKIRLFFYKSLIEKTKANKKAPNPAALIN